MIHSACTFVGSCYNDISWKVMVISYDMNLRSLGLYPGIYGNILPGPEVRESEFYLDFC